MFASKCQGECHAMKAALCELGDPGWGDPWFPALLLPTPSELAHCIFVAGLIVGFFYEPASTWHRSCHFACTEMIHHLLLQLIFFTYKLELSRHCLVVRVGVLVVCFCFCVFVFCVCLFFVFVFCCFVSWCLHKSDQKHMSSQKVFTSRHGLFV